MQKFFNLKKKNYFTYLFNLSDNWCEYHTFEERKRVRPYVSLLRKYTRCRAVKIFLDFTSQLHSRSVVNEPWDWRASLSCRNRHREKSSELTWANIHIIGLSHDRVRDTQTRQVARLLHMHRRVARLIGGTLITLYPFIVCTVERVILRRVSPRQKFTELRYSLHITAYLRKRER